MEMNKRKIVYIGMIGDFLHHGHINIIEEARKLGEVTIGLLTDEAAESYKKTNFYI
jgi:cytidyltransferase-like protein